MSAELSEAEQQEVLENIPENLRQLRACLTCRLIKAVRQWDQGCPNCGWDEPMANTTPVFKGSAATLAGTHTPTATGSSSCTTQHPTMPTADERWMCVVVHRVLAMMQPGTSWVARWQKQGQSAHRPLILSSACSSNSLAPVS